MLQKPAPEIGAICLNLTQDSGASLSCRCTGPGGSQRR